MEQILIVEDDTTLNQGLCKALREKDRQIVSCESISEAKEQLQCDIYLCRLYQCDKISNTTKNRS